jgi:hypothetical protein
VAMEKKNVRKNEQRVKAKCYKKDNNYYKYNQKLCREYVERTDPPCKTYPASMSTLGKRNSTQNLREPDSLLQN